MKENIHPDYYKIKVSCSCNNVMHIQSTVAEDTHVEICHACHPHYTKKKRESKAGRIEKFRGKYKKLNLTTQKQSGTESV